MSASYARHNAGPAPRAIIRMGPEHTVVGTLELDDVDWKIRNELEPLFGIPPNIWVQSQCSADDFKTYIPSVSGFFVSSSLKETNARLSLSFIRRCHGYDDYYFPVVDNRIFFSPVGDGDSGSGKKSQRSL